MTDKGTALLVFSRTAAAEARQKPFCSRFRKRLNETIAQKLIEQTREIARLSGMPVIYSDESSQYGDSFGMRLSHAIENVFEKGFESIIVIGNDSPGLSTRDILRVEKLLQNEDLILGPATDGGLYLIGIHRNCFDTMDFSSLAWKTPQLQESIKNYLEFSSLQVHWLNPLNDIDNERDLINAVSESIVSLRFRSFIKSVLAGFDSLICRIPQLESQIYQAGYKTPRAPPFAF